MPRNTKSRYVAHKIIAVLSSAALLMMAVNAGPAFAAPPKSLPVSTDETAGANSSRASIVNAEASRAAVAASNNLGVAVLKEQASEDQIANLLLSPLSLGIACAVIEKGCKGQTKSAVDNALYGRGPVADAAWQALISSTLSPEARVERSLATGLFVDRSVKLRSGYLAQCKSIFDAECESVNFQAASTMAEINAWIKAKTHGRINRLVQSNPVRVLLLLSSLYFKGEWTDKFQVSITSKSQFFLSGGKTKSVQMMHKGFEMPVRYFENDQIQLVGLTYGKLDQKQPQWRPLTEMFIILPTKRDGLTDLCNTLSAAKIDKWIESSSSRQGRLSLPRFHIESSNRLESALSKLGFGSLFTNANFEDMFVGPSSGIGGFRQSLMLDLNENGTEAAALTEVDFLKGVSHEPFRMVVDHPFLFVLKDISSGAFNFIGVVNDPHDSALSKNEVEKILIDGVNKEQKSWEQEAAVIQLVNFYVKEKAYDKACDSLQKQYAREILKNPTNYNAPRTLQSLAKVQVMANRIPDAIKTYEKLLALTAPNSFQGRAQTVHRYALLLKHEGRNASKPLTEEEGLLKSALEEAKKNNPSNDVFLDDYRMRLARFYFEQGNLKLAEELARQVDKGSHSKNRESLDLLIQVYKRTGCTAQIARVQSALDDLDRDVKAFLKTHSKFEPILKHQSQAAAEEHVVDDVPAFYRAVYGQELP